MFGLDVGAAVLTRFIAREENHTSRLLRVPFKHEVTKGDSFKTFVPNRLIPSVRLIGSAWQLLPTLPRTLLRRPSWRSSFLGDPGAKFLCGKLAIGTKKEKRSKKKERPVGTVGGNKSSTGGTNSLEEQMPEGSRVSRFSRHLLGVPPPLMHCSLLRIPVPGVNRPSSDSLLRADGRVND